MITDMHNGYWLYRFMKDMYQTWLVHLVDEDIELELLGHGVYFQLATPSCTFGHMFTVFTDWVFWFFVLGISSDKRFEVFWVVLDVFNGLGPIHSLLRLVTIKLISNRSKKTISISTHWVDDQSNCIQFPFELFQVLFYLDLIKNAHFFTLFYYFCFFTTFKHFDL